MENLKDFMERMGLSESDFDEEPPFDEKPAEVIEYGPFKETE